jgi:hypothetical protein
MPRLHHQLFPNLVEFEQFAPEELVLKLAEKFGHEVQVPQPSLLGCFKEAVSITNKSDGRRKKTEALRGPSQPLAAPCSPLQPLAAPYGPMRLLGAPHRPLWPLVAPCGLTQLVTACWLVG